jgi:hypothetical protein
MEALQKSLRSRRLYRCHACNWRGWGDETALRWTPPQDLPTPEPLDLVVVDDGFGSKGDSPPASDQR